LELAEDHREFHVGQEIAEHVKVLIEGQYPYGIYHFVNETSGRPPTRFEIGEEIARIFGKQMRLHFFQRLPAQKYSKRPVPTQAR